MLIIFDDYLKIETKTLQTEVRNTIYWEPRKQQPPVSVEFGVLANSVCLRWLLVLVVVHH